MYLSDGKCVVVEFDDTDQPIGEEQGVLAGFCGILATDCSLFPIHFNNWPDLPKSYFNGCFDRIIKPRFCFKTTELNARAYVYSSIRKKWSSGRQRLWYEFNDPLKTKAWIMDNVPSGIPRDEWTSYVSYRFNEKTMEMSKRNVEIRKKQTIAHTGGSKPNSRRRAEMMAESGQNPGRAQLYLATHKKEDGSLMKQQEKYVNLSKFLYIPSSLCFCIREYI
uniref:Uncharacterized protein LOC104238578 isoform X1 n=1 Tax=Nicotiana sylvestris TaxID=4096 RepID=A0A1U7XWG9_NICSY|nr:PREDICTED: uncharacterized protein LOC104238578 isoform X1 [Nicotiana sylvestris]XP_009791280.1 PREDICTED: uncharacterized protein LOC104238578 isoform X1 [Nicotiana sylvestris]XP_009791281.1 PREDICTED: uncharacterized protein LOC104238578 isoform X1 [Nicotiana sylvestris]XP_009791282.1 PREDICTED: uncharacterized protein LOC104238578 isoform X1 [Nicotiana sylvestris]